jgi:hypothetical protein
MGGTIALRTVQIDTLVIDVFQNSQGDSLTEDFVQWPFYLEVGPGEGSLSRGRFIAELRALLQRLRDSEVDAVPACDFEDELV